MSFQAPFKYLALVLAAAGYAVAEPTRPGLTYLYSLNGTLGEPFTTGVGPHGTRAVLTVLGGPFSGPNISGKQHTLTVRRHLLAGAYKNYRTGASYRCRLGHR